MQLAGAKLSASPHSFSTPSKPANGPQSPESSLHARTPHAAASAVGMRPPQSGLQFESEGEEYLTAGNREVEARARRNKILLVGGAGADGYRLECDSCDLCQLEFFPSV